jgi:hypothetical protein
MKLKQHEPLEFIRGKLVPISFSKPFEFRNGRLVATEMPRPPIYEKEPIPSDIRWAVWERDNFTCKHCGVRSHLAIDHIYPQSKGGEMSLSNLQTLCCSCNSRKGARVSL